MPTGAQVAAPAPVELIRDGAGAAPLFLFHPGGLGCECYRPLVDRLVPEVGVYGCGQLEESATISQRAARYLEWITRLQPAGPYRLAGWSFGGFLAWETAAQSERFGLPVEFVVVIDAIHPLRTVRSRQEMVGERFAWLRTLVERDTGRPCELPCERLARLDEAHQIDAVIELVRPQVSDRLRHRLLGEIRSGLLHELILERHRPGRFEGPFVLFRCTERDSVAQLTRYDTTDPSLGWAACRATPIRPIPLPGSHWSVMHDPAVTVLARTLNTLMTEEIRG